MLWNNKDVDKNGYLDREEAREFVEEISKCIGKERSMNYNANNFDELFDRFDYN